MLADGITTVGRQEDCQLRVGSSQVSRKHCQLFEQEGRLVVIDLGSSNGTYVNGKKVEGQQVLRPGDVLSLGRVKFRVEKLDGTGVPKPSDTAVAEVEIPSDDAGSSEEFEISFDDETEDKKATPQAMKAVKDDTVREKKEKKEVKPSKPELGDDAVADFLLNIDLDDEKG